MQFETIDELRQYPDDLGEDHKDLLKDAASLSHLAYQPGPDIVKLWHNNQRDVVDGGIMSVRQNPVLNRLMTAPEVIGDPNLGLQAFAAEYRPKDFRENVLAVVVRGSNDVLDWLMNVQIFKDDFGDPDLKGVEVHRGFLQQYRSFVGQYGHKIDDFLRKPGEGPRIVLFTGHSLGAAVSTLLALRYTLEAKRSGIAAEFWNVTFGSPRVGNDQFKDAFRAGVNVILRVKHRRDPVCKSVPRSLGYVHVCSEIHLGEADPFPLPFLWDIDDHAHWNYIRVLNGQTAWPPKPRVPTTKLFELVQQRVPHKVTEKSDG